MRAGRGNRRLLRGGGVFRRGVIEIVGDEFQLIFERQLQIGHGMDHVGGRVVDLQQLAQVDFLAIAVFIFWLSAQRMWLRADSCSAMLSSRSMTAWSRVTRGSAGHSSVGVQLVSVIINRVILSLI